MSAAPALERPRARPPARRPGAALKVLVIAANPATSRQLRVREEIKKIRAQLRRARTCVPIKLRACPRASRARVADEIMRFRPHVVHFIAHGAAFDGILLEGEDGAAEPLDEGTCGELFQVLGRSVRVVVLNACFSRPCAAAIARHVDCAIGMNMPIEDAAAVAFAATFYGAIGEGCSVQEAFALANALEQGGARPELLPNEREDPAEIVLVSRIPPPHWLPRAMLVTFVLACAALVARALLGA